MSRKLPGSAIVPGTITVTQITGGLNDTTNASYAQANTARNTANDAYGQANTARDQANTARTQANTAYDQANNARGQANTAYGQANAAYDQANASYNVANTKLASAGGTLSGDLIITGNLTVSGNSTTLNTEILTVEDAEVVLLSNVASTPALNAGVIVNRGTSANTFLRWDEALDEWGWSDSGNTTYYFEDLRAGLATTNTTFGTVNTSLGTINTSYQAAYAQANTAGTNALNAYGQANTARTTANDAYGQANTARNTANSAYGQANTATTNAGNAYDTANNASTASNRLISQDLRTIAPNSHTAARLTFGFTSYTNNGNASTYADYLHFRSYVDSSGGSDNLVMFHKSGIGMRIWQQTWNSSSAYSNYVDVLHSSNYSSYAVPLSGGTMTGTLVVQTDGGNEQFKIVRSSNTNEQLLFGFHSSDYGTIQAVEQNVAYRPLALNPNGGSVGVGTTTPGTAKLYVKGQGSGGFNAIFEDPVASGYCWIQIKATGGGSNSSWQIGAYQSGLQFYNDNNSAYRVFFGDNGNVGIGTTSPGNLLHLFGASNPFLRIQAGGGNYSYVRLDDGSTNGYLIKNLSADTTNGALAGALYTYTDNSKAFQHIHAGTPLFTILSGGNVGIGTTSPGQKLEVAGNIFVNTSGNPYLELKTSGAGNNPYLRLTAASNYWDIQGTFSNTNDELFFMYNGSTRLAIQSGGNVGIGTNSPSTTLDVNGSISASNIAAPHHMAKSRTTFTVGGSSSNYYPVIIQIWGGATSYQYSSFIIERGGYDDPGYTGIGFSNMHAKFSLTASGWGFGSDYIAMDHYKGTYNAIAKWYQEIQTSRIVIWLRGATQYNLLNVVGTATLINGNSGGTQLVTDYNTLTVESSVQSYATYTRVNDGTLWQDGNLNVIGTLSKAAGSFKIDHPLPQKSNTNYLVHSFIEGPQADLYYSGKAQLQNGLAIINIDSVSNMTEGTFEALCRNIRCFVTNESNWDLVRGSVENNLLTIVSQNSNSTANVSWLVVGERKDKFMLETDWTDDEGRVIVEPTK